MRKGLWILAAAVIVVISFWVIKEKSLQNTSRDEENNEAQQETAEIDPITEKINAMNIDEKIGQLFISGIEGSELTEETAEMIQTNALGGIILFQPNLEEPDASLALVNDIKELETAEDIPFFISVDEEGGIVERLPGLAPMMSAAEVGEQDADFARAHGQLLAELLKAYGMQLNYAPVLDINSNPDNPVIGERAFGADAEQVADIGIQVMKGMQEEGVITAVKHFPGHGDTKEDSHEALPVVHKTREELDENELIPFQSAVNAGADMVLMSHIKLPELGIDQPASFSEAAVAILREDWDYDGVVVTDDLTMGAVTDNYQMEEVTVEAVNAGVDMLMIAHEEKLLQEGISGVKQAVENGNISEDRIDESVRRILELKEKYNVNAEPVDSISVEELNDKIEEHQR